MSVGENEESKMAALKFQPSFCFTLHHSGNIFCYSSHDHHTLNKIISSFLSVLCIGINVSIGVRLLTLGRSS